MNLAYNIISHSKTYYIKLFICFLFLTFIFSSEDGVSETETAIENKKEQKKMIQPVLKLRFNGFYRSYLVD